MHRPTVGSYGGAVSYERGTPVAGKDPVGVVLQDVCDPSSGQVEDGRVNDGS